ncbi:MAG: ABC transporter permease [Acidimicrobiia bacterium]
MTSLAIKELWAHKRRVLGMFFAVFLGVAFLSGTLALGDTMRANFDTLFSEANANTDVVVRRATEINTDAGESGAQRGLIDETLVGEIAAVDGVAAAAPFVQGIGQLIGEDGDRIGGNGPPTIAGNWIEDPDLNPYRLAEGRAPEAGNEVVINRGAADDGGLAIGDTTTVQTSVPVEVEIVGISTFGDEDGLGPTTFTAFTLEAAQEHVTGRPGMVTSISVQADDGVSQDELVERVQPVLPDDFEAITGTELTAENVEQINNDFLDMFTTFLAVFGGVAILVGTFSIQNTFSILVAQRGREAALLRAIGAGQGQVLTSVVLEALVIGAVASLAGLFGGLGIATLLKALLAAFGFGVPAGGLVFDASTAVTGLGVGIAVTLIASAVPAYKASRAAPLAALREVEVDRTGTSVLRAVTGLALAAGGIAVVLAAVVGDRDDPLPLAGLGSLLLIVGAVVFGPVVSRSAAAVLGAPLAALRGVVGSLARQNAMRNPRRTSGAASALMIGVGVVTLFTVFAASLKASIDDSLSRSFTGDLVVTTGQFGGSGLSPQLTRNVTELPEVSTVVALGETRVLVDDATKDVTITDTALLDDVADLRVTDGALADLDSRELAVSDEVADDEAWRVGTSVPVTFADGTTSDYTIGAVYGDSTITGDYVLPRTGATEHLSQSLDSAVLIGLASGVPLNDGKDAVEAAVEPYGAPDVQDRDQYVDSIAGNVDTLLGLVYVMLALAVVIALLGISNTLSLSIYERRRELGLLRAVGQTRRQLRAMIRWESVIVALFGTLGGLALGVFLGWALVQTAASATGGPFGEIGTFAAPPVQLLVVLIVGAAAGMLAAIRPARRAARLDALQAIASQ